MQLCRHERFLARYREASAGRYLDECWPWPGTRNAKGYGVIVIAYRQYVASRIVLDEYDPDVQVMHTCDNPPCVNPAHLQRGTIQQNQYDKGRKGRAAKGMANRGGNRLTDDDVREIKRRLRSPENPTLASLGREFGVSGVMIGYINRGQQWRHIE